MGVYRLVGAFSKFWYRGGNLCMASYIEYMDKKEKVLTISLTELLELMIAGDHYGLLDIDPLYTKGAK